MPRKIPSESRGKGVGVIGGEVAGLAEYLPKRKLTAATAKIRRVKMSIVGGFEVGGVGGIRGCGAGGVNGVSGLVDKGGVSIFLF